MKYTKLFNQHSEYVAYTGGTAFIRPNVSWCRLEDESHCTPAGYIPPHDYSQDYLTFKIRTNGKVYLHSNGGVAKTIDYSLNDGAWSSITATDSSTFINVSEGDVVRFRGENESYSTSKSGYTGFGYGERGNTEQSGYDSDAAEFDIEGNIMSLVYGDDFIGQTAMTGTYNFCSIFKKAKCISAEHLVLPTTTLTDYCYRAMFSWDTYLAIPPQLPATTLAQGCYWYMFEHCTFTTSPDLPAKTLVQECYGHMFENCNRLNYIKCLATGGFNTNSSKTDWVKSVASTGTFVKDPDTPIASGYWSRGASAIPANWVVFDEGTPDVPTISCDGFEIELSCTTDGADIYYRLTNSGSYSLYSTAIAMTGDTFIECYAEKDGYSSTTTSQTCEYDDRTIYEYANQSIDNWTRSGSSVTVPNSVNAIDGHSANYKKGTFEYETTVTLRGQQPTYLWFQHADHQADIYVDNVKVDTHWGGYNAFFSDISNYTHKGVNNIRVALTNNKGDYLAPASGDFNFNATLGKVKLFTSPYMPAMNYGYDGFHITSTVSTAEATINVKTSIPTGATVVCTISGVNCNYTATSASTSNEMTFTTTITNPRLWNGKSDPYLYNVKLEIYHDNELYHRYERPYGLRFYEYVINDTVKYGTAGNPYTGFLLNGQPYLLRGCCMHDDIADKANALNDADYTQTFNIIQELGLNFLRLAHYPHPKEVYDWCDRLGIVVQTEGSCVNKLQSTMPTEYYERLNGQYTDMVNQHYNHPCIFFWGLSNETSTDDKAFGKQKVEEYTALIKNLDSERMVGYVLAQGNGTSPSAYYNDPSNVDWFGCNIYVGWYDSPNSNNPTSQITTRLNNTINRAGVNKPMAYSEYGCGGTPTCHSDDFMTTTTRGNNPRHDIEYMMWLHEGHIAAIKNFPQLLYTSQWQLFDIAVSSRNEGYTECLDGINTSTNDALRRLNNKGLVERDHVTKKDTFYLYKAWWNTADTFVHICGKNYTKSDSRVIKCYTNETGSLTMYINGTSAETVSITNNIATFTARNFYGNNTIIVSGATASDTFTLTGGTDPSLDYVEIAGTKWAKMNVGANTPTDYGLYFQWGDVSGYTAAQVGSGSGQKYFGWADYKYGNGAGYPGTTGITKYNNSDAKTELEPSDDAAIANWGNGWRMPTTAELQALGNAVNTAWTTDYQGSGVSGLVCTDKTDSSKVLFFPAAGRCYGGNLRDVNSHSTFWTSSLYSSDILNAYRLSSFSNATFWINNLNRYYGCNIRPVKEKYEYVDLGLPSGTLWAKTNVGASSETDCGNYYQYGKGAYDYSVTSGDNIYYGEESPLSPSADTATQVLGEGYFMPRERQFNELTTNTTYEWTTINGVNGGKFTATDGSGKYIFLPAVGYYYEGGLIDSGTSGSYWSSTPYQSTNAISLGLNNEDSDSNIDYRGYGFAIRSVKNPYDAEIEYLENSGTTYIDTGIIPDSNTGIYVKSSSGYSSVYQTEDVYIVGLRDNAGDTRWAVGHNKNGYYYGYGVFDGNSYVATNADSECKLNYLNDKKWVVNNTEKSTLPSTMPFTAVNNIRLFGSAGYDNPSSTYYRSCKGKIYFVKISQGSNVIMDLIPVRKNGIGYMYDKISGNLYGKSGSGEFILGPDKNQ